jgi:hypothetical protein
MGLDMFLDVRKYVTRVDWSKVPEQLPEGITHKDFETADFTTVKSMFPTELLKHNNHGSYVSFNIAYWRKAYAIHEWFTQNMSGRLENGQGGYLSREDLVELLNTVTKVLKGNLSTAQKLLPDTSLSSSYDKYYYEDLRHTKEMLTDVLKVIPENDMDYDFHYNGSW